MKFWKQPLSKYDKLQDIEETTKTTRWNIENRPLVKTTPFRHSDHPCIYREEHSVDRCRCRPELSERFGSHWSIWISRGIRMDQSLGAFISGKICVDQWPWKFLKSLPRLALVHGWLFPGLCLFASGSMSMSDWLRGGWRGRGHAWCCQTLTASAPRVVTSD